MGMEAKWSVQTVDVAVFRIGDNIVALNARRKREFRAQGS